MISFFRNFKKLRSYCQDESIQLSWSLMGDNFASRFGGKYIIYVSPYQSLSLIISTILHEIGHTMTWKGESVESREKLRFVRARINYVPRPSDQKDTYTLEEASVIIDDETSAWVNGLLIAQKLGVKVPKNYKDQWKKSVRSYQDYFNKNKV